MIEQPDLQYIPAWLRPEETAKLVAAAHTMNLTQRDVVLFERTVKMPRLTAWANDRGFGYGYSNQITPAEPWPAPIMTVRRQLEVLTNTELASVLVNVYRDGQDSVSYHKDDEMCFGPNPVIVSLSCGATRRFKLRNRTTKEKLDFMLSNGDVIILKGPFVREWEHCIPKTAKPVGERVNFTFRSIN